EDPAQQAAMAAIGFPCTSAERCNLPKLLRDRARVPHRIDHHAAQRLRAMPIRPELERRDGPEVAAGLEKGSEQSGIFRLAGEAKLAVGGHNVDRYEVVRGIAELARGPAEAAAHGETRDAGIGHDPARNHQTERLCLVIDVAPCRAAFDPNDPT